MTKLEFMTRLKTRLSGLPAEELSERLAFFGEMIDDRIEDGLSEEDAVAAIGSVEDAAARVVSETPLISIVKGRVSKRGRSRARDVLVIATAPIWASVLFAFGVVAFCLYVAAWSVALALWALELPLYILHWIENGTRISAKYTTIGLSKFTKFGSITLKKWIMGGE